MRKLKKVLIAVFLISSVISGFASVDYTTKNDEGTSIIIKKRNGQGSTPDKDDPCITASISGHTLTMNFAQNIGSVLVEISDGQSFMVVTPDTAQAYITSSGSYTVNFTLSNGDEYYGHFVVF